MGNRWKSIERRKRNGSRKRKVQRKEGKAHELDKI
jgi:hypothetical protein